MHRLTLDFSFHWNDEPVASTFVQTPACDCAFRRPGFILQFSTLFQPIPDERADDQDYQARA
jgi:hypothetical protein